MMRFSLQARDEDRGTIQDLIDGAQSGFAIPSVGESIIRDNMEFEVKSRTFEFTEQLMLVILHVSKMREL